MVQHISFQDVQVPVPGFGAMGLSMAYGKADDSESFKTLQKAIDLGCTFWDTAVLYGSGHNEQLIGDFFKETGTRDQVFIASKCGLECIGKSWTEMTISNKASHINEYIEGTIARLGSAPDLYYLHRMDPNTDLEESITAMDKLKKDGKCKYIGLSECGVDTLRKACAIAKIDAIQIEYSPWCTEGEESGLIAAARELGVVVVGYSPLCRGFLSGRYRKPEDFDEDDFRRTLPRFSAENMPKNLTLLEKFESLASKKGTTPSQLALAWVASQGVIPIPGTKTSGRLEENFAARDVKLSDEEVQEIRDLVDQSKPHGERYDAGHMQTLDK